MANKPRFSLNTIGGGRNSLRIIGGRWRGRKVQFPGIKDLRPTPNRVRETLFNWLQPVVENSQCLDLFSGSGALGLEAASRGAKKVWLVDYNRDVIASLGACCDRLKTTVVEIVHADSITWLQQTSHCFDIVFLDPPFSSSDLIEQCVHILENKHCLSANARIYIEIPAATDPPALPNGWYFKHRKNAGHVAFFLAIRTGDPEKTASD